ncbi:MAG: hypothetical protein QOE93_1450 [Actinomycetota bacterium]|jgi:hypothetical protein|nr:hypothetical protein [Actinomycetota bacterium]
MATWSDVEAAAPELAATVKARFEAFGLGLLATVRKDGSPRISGVEPLFALGELWLGMMPGSRKALDLGRDPRFALHNATTDKNVTDGDAKIGGSVVAVQDEAEFARFLEAFAAATGYPPPPGSFPLFKADVWEVSTVKPAGDHLDIESWREGRGVRKVERY